MIAESSDAPPAEASRRRVAIIDIGSNSIKLLVAAAGPEGRPVARRMKTLDARVSAGISRARPELGEEGMARGLAAIRELLAEAEAEKPRGVVLAATSAVRDAANGAEFRARVRAATGCEIRILSGEEEANLIGRGLACDPALGGLRDFYLFDLGGGSLECLAFRGRQAVQEVSLRLGCVRLTEKFVVEPALPFPASAEAAIAGHAREAFTAARFAFSLPAEAAVVGTGGTLTHAREVLAAARGATLEQTSAEITVAQLRELLGRLGALPLAERRQVPGLPPARADVFPAALATLLAVAEIGRFTVYRHSLYNLRWGLAAEALGI